MLCSKNQGRDSRKISLQFKAVRDVFMASLFCCGSKFLDSEKYVVISHTSTIQAENKKDKTEENNEIEEAFITETFQTKKINKEAKKDPLSKILQITIRTRVQYDILFCVFNFLICFAIHSSSILYLAQPYFEVCKLIIN